jgi:hypothetical protein
MAWLYPIKLLLMLAMFLLFFGFGVLAADRFNSYGVGFLGYVILQVFIGFPVDAFLDKYLRDEFKE